MLGRFQETPERERERVRLNKNKREKDVCQKKERKRKKLEMGKIKKLAENRFENRFVETGKSASVLF